jgi:hypothetical protein
MKNSRPIGPYSRMLHRGIIGRSIDGRTAIGRLCRELQKRLITHVGGVDATLDSIPITARVLIDRAVRITIQLHQLDEKLASGNWTDHDARTQGGLNNALRLILTKDLGLKPAEAKPPRLADLLKQMEARKQTA